MSHVTVTTIIQACDIEKIIEGSRIDDVIQHGNNILALWKAHVL